jgi:hypothetical protein
VSGNALHGVISGAAWTTAGRFGNGLSFDGVNDWVTIADHARLDLTTGMTLEAWVRPAALAGFTTVVQKERGTTSLAYSLYGSNDSSRPPAGYINLSGIDHSAVGPDVLPLSTWSHLAATYDGTVLLLYVNGVQVASRSVGGSISTSADPLRIGGNAIWGEYFDGLIDEVRIYNRALTPAEIQADMNTPVGGGGGGLASDGHTGGPNPPAGPAESDPDESTPVDPPSAVWSAPGVLASVVEEAVARWAGLGASPDQLATLRNLTVSVADLAGSQLGFASGSSIWIDRDAAGHWWYIDPTPGDDSEFRLPGDQGEQGRVDLLTLLVHEMGHVLGHGHSRATGAVMSETLPPGVRRTALDGQESGEELPEITTPPAPILVTDPAPGVAPMSSGLESTGPGSTTGGTGVTLVRPRRTSGTPVSETGSGNRTELQGPYLPPDITSTVQQVEPVAPARQVDPHVPPGRLSMEQPAAIITARPNRLIGSLAAITTSADGSADPLRQTPGAEGRVQVTRPRNRTTQDEPPSQSGLPSTQVTPVDEGITRITWGHEYPDTFGAYWGSVLDEDELPHTRVP